MAATVITSQSDYSEYAEIINSQGGMGAGALLNAGQSKLSIFPSSCVRAYAGERPICASRNKRSRAIKPSMPITA